MDVLIQKDGAEVILSSLGIFSIDFSDSSPTLKVNRTEIDYRSGYLPTGVVYQRKKFTISGKFYSSTILAMEEKKDELNGLISNDEPFYITKMVPTQADLYDFELPGDGNMLDLLNIPHEVYKYRYKVSIEDSISYRFHGKSGAGLLTSFSINLQTAELPFGETVPVDEIVTGSISYKGTAKCNQLEWPFIIRLTSTATQSGQISLQIGEKTFTYQATTPLVNGDKLLLKGVETTLNTNNVNDKTNYEHFILKPTQSGKIPVLTNFVGTIEILNKAELYV